MIQQTRTRATRIPTMRQAMLPAMFLSPLLRDAGDQDGVPRDELRLGGADGLARGRSDLDVFRVAHDGAVPVVGGQELVVDADVRTEPVEKLVAVGLGGVGRSGAVIAARFGPPGSFAPSAQLLHL